MDEALFHWIQDFFKLNQVKNHYQLLQSMLHLIFPDDFPEPDEVEEDNWALNLKKYEELKKQLSLYDQSAN